VIQPACGRVVPRTRATASARLAEPVLVSICLTCHLTVGVVMKRRSAIRALVKPSATSRRISSCRCVSGACGWGSGVLWRASSCSSAARRCRSADVLSSASWASLASVMSCAIPTRRIGSPASSTTTSPRLRSVRTLPSARSARYSSTNAERCATAWSIAWRTRGRSAGSTRCWPPANVGSNSSGASP
jgi:hypothetical protein